VNSFKTLALHRSVSAQSLSHFPAFARRRYIHWCFGLAVFLFASFSIHLWEKKFVTPPSTGPSLYVLLSDDEDKKLTIPSFFLS